MVVKVCLLITDDPDDHTEFSEALYEISDDTVLVSVSDIGKAINLLALKRCIPEYLFINLSIPDFSAEKFFGTLNGDPAFNDTRILAYGDTVANSDRVTAFLDPDTGYSELKAALRKILEDPRLPGRGG